MAPRGDAVDQGGNQEGGKKYVKGGETAGGGIEAMIGFRPPTEVTLMPDPFADLLLRLRQEAGRTQEEQAEAINAVSGRDTMTRREISRYENFENIPTNTRSATSRRPAVSPPSRNYSESQGRPRSEEKGACRCRGRSKTP